MKGLGFPVIVKPAHLGSSIGVAKADDLETARAVLPAIFKFDTTAIVEPFVENLVEYNVAVTRIGGEVRDLGDRAAEARDRAARLQDEIHVRRRIEEDRQAAGRARARACCR